eukprot:706757_1
MKALVNDFRESPELGGRGDDAFVYVEKKEKTKKKRQYSAFGYHLFSVMPYGAQDGQWYKFDGENSKQCVLQYMNCVLNWMAMCIKIRGLRIYLRNDVWNMRCRCNIY